MSDTTLKFPSGKFTHTELAQHNGKTNQQVWTAYQAAIKDGTIIAAGERPNLSGKGKPSRLWEVNPNKGVATTPLAVVAVPTVAPVVKVVTPKPVKVVKVVEPKKADIVKAVEPKAATVAPTVAPEPEPEAEVVHRPLMVNALTSQVTEIEETCPFCHTKLLMVAADGRVRVWCPVNDYKICSCSENPYGVAKNVKDAVQIIHDKYFDKK